MLCGKNGRDRTIVATLRRSRRFAITNDNGHRSLPSSAWNDARDSEPFDPNRAAVGDPDPHGGRCGASRAGGAACRPADGAGDVHLCAPRGYAEDDALTQPGDDGRTDPALSIEVDTQVCRHPSDAWH
jgi:hypothetical protein